MSEIASYQTTIKIPSLAQRTSIMGTAILDQEPRAALLQRAVALLAEDHRGQMVSRVRDCDGKDIPCVLGVKTPDLPLGLGVVVGPEGRLSFVYDSHGDAQGWGKRLAGELQANYNALALRLALQAMNLEVQVTEIRSRGRRFVQVEGKV